ncbi:MAG: OmpA family protein [Endomicrobium sp.]|jgi:outer membrane protein OmpA-like peptidoglycan-associated protein|nr:OmpA family protein [Endomicrobium sp.]
MKFYLILTALVFSLFINIFFVSSSHAGGSDVFTPYVQYNRIDSDNLDTGTIAIKGEFIFDFIYHKLGDYWYTSKDPLGINKYFNYKPKDSSGQPLKMDNKWQDTYGQTFLFNVGIKPVDWFFAEFGFAMIGDYADKYWVPVNQEHRMDGWNKRGPQFEWNNAKIGIKNDWASLTYFKNYGHMDWRYEGDMFDLFPVMDNPDDYLRYSGHHSTDFWQLKMRGIWGDIDAIYGEEALQDYDQGAYLKYTNIFGTGINFYYTDHQIPYGNPEVTQWNNLTQSSQDFGDSRERMRTFEVSKSFNVIGNTLQVGAMYRPFRLGWDYEYAEDVGSGNGLGGTKYDIHEGTTKEIDALGGSVKLSIPKKVFGIDLVKLGYEYRGLVAGNRQKADISAEKKISKYSNIYAGYYYQKPLLSAMPMIYSGGGSGPLISQGRGPESPFWVWWRKGITGFDNRETSALSFVYTYDPTPSTWFYQFEPNQPIAYNLNPEEDAPFSFAVKVNFERYFGTLDRQTYWEYDGSTVWEDSYSNGTDAPDRYVGSLYFLSQFVKGELKVLYDFEIGEDLATLSYPYPNTKGAAAREEFTTPMIGYFKTSLIVKRKPYLFKAAYFKNYWGPEDWHKFFGSTYDELYLTHIDRNIGEWFNVGVEYIAARKTNQTILDSIAGEESKNETGYFDEIRIFFKVLFDVTLRFGSKDQGAPFMVEYDKTPPEVALKASPDIIYPESNQKCIIEPWVSDYSGIDTWIVTIKNTAGETVKTYSGDREPPYELEWNGKEEETRKDLPDAPYYAVLEAVDNYGNRAETEPIRIIVASTPKEAEIEETERGLVITLGAKVLFDFDKYNLKRGARQTLKEVADLLTMYPDNKISVEGHTDWKGAVSYNQKLSENRAKSVRDFLIKEGVASERINMIGYGKLKPVASNETAEGRDQNRRVEIVILKDDGSDVNLSEENIEAVK